MVLPLGQVFAPEPLERIQQDEALLRGHVVRCYVLVGGSAVGISWRSQILRSLMEVVAWRDMLLGKSCFMYVGVKLRAAKPE